MNKSSIAKELIQIRPKWVISDNGDDVNRWSRVHPRFEMHDGCVVDLGCLGWNRPFEEIDSDNWAGYFFDKKRVIGVDPQENMNPKAELFRGFISNFSGKGVLISTGIGATLFKSTGGFFEFLNWGHFKQKFNIRLIIRAILSRTLAKNFEVLNWHDFKQKFNIKSISVLKINIEGSEWDLIDSFKSEDFSDIDQICVSFHDFLPEFRNYSSRTDECVKKIISNGYLMVDLDIYGWKLFLKAT